jgi:hypothetical protein
VDLVAVEEAIVDIEAEDVAHGPVGFILGVPVPSDPGGVILTQDWIEDGLGWQTGREPPPAARLDEAQFDRPNRSKECYHLTSLAGAGASSRGSAGDPLRKRYRADSLSLE